MMTGELKCGTENDRALLEKVRRFDTFSNPLCPRCGNGMPVCADLDDRLFFNHHGVPTLACGCPPYRYRDLCANCDKESRQPQ